MPIIKFNAVSKLTELSVKAPKPSRDYLPEWYKDIPAFQNGKPTFDNTGTTDRTINVYAISRLFIYGLYSGNLAGNKYLIK